MPFLLEKYFFGGGKMEKVVFLTADCQNFLTENYREYRNEFSKLPDPVSNCGELLLLCVCSAWSTANLEFYKLIAFRKNFAIDLRKVFATLNSKDYEIVVGGKFFNPVFAHIFCDEYEEKFIAIFVESLLSELKAYGSKRQKRKLDPIVRSLQSVLSKYDSFKADEDFWAEYLTIAKNCSEWPESKLRE